MTNSNNNRTYTNNSRKFKKIEIPEELKKELVYEFTKRSEAIRNFRYDTLHEQLCLEGYANAYEWLAQEIVNKDGFECWE